MAMKFEDKNVTGVTSKQVLMFPDHYVAFTYKLSKGSSLAVTEGTKKIVKAGTIFPANNDTAVGVILNDYDVTNGDQHAAIVVHGFFSIHKIPAAPTPAAEAALKQISFFPLKTTLINIRYNDLKVGEAGGSIVVQVSGTRFKSVPTITGDSPQVTFSAGTTGLTLKAIEMTPDGRTVTIDFNGTAAAGQATLSIAAAAFVNNKASNEITIALPNTNRQDTVSDNAD